MNSIKLNHFYLKYLLVCSAICSKIVSGIISWKQPNESWEGHIPDDRGPGFNGRSKTTRPLSLPRTLWAAARGAAILCGLPSASLEPEIYNSTSWTYMGFFNNKMCFWYQGFIWTGFQATLLKEKVLKTSSYLALRCGRVGRNGSP